MGFTLVTSIPEICNIKCLCFKCGLKNFPDLLQDWWCEGVYCCNFNNFGLKELLMFQYFLFGPCSLIAPACNLTFAVPEALTVNIFCQKCGIQDFPDFRVEDFIRQTMCCIHYEFGFKDILKVLQLFCLKFETGVRVGV